MIWGVTGPEGIGRTLMSGLGTGFTRTGRAFRNADVAARCRARAGLKRDCRDASHASGHGRGGRDDRRVEKIGGFDGLAREATRVANRLHGLRTGLASALHHANLLVDLDQTHRPPGSGRQAHAGGLQVAVPQRCGSIPAPSPGPSSNALSQHGTGPPRIRHGGPRRRLRAHNHPVLWRSTPSGRLEATVCLHRVTHIRVAVTRIVAMRPLFRDDSVSVARKRCRGARSARVGTRSDPTTDQHCVNALMALLGAVPWSWAGTMRGLLPI